MKIFFPGYDCKFIFKELAKDSRIRNISIVGQSSEKFLSVRSKRFVFIDSFLHQSVSLEKLTENLKEHGKEHFHALSAEFPDAEKFELLLGKGSFPYEYVSSLDVLKEKIPERDAFYSNLTCSNISDEDYARVKKTEEVFELKTLEDLLRLYVKQDVLLLCDVMNFYRKITRESYNLESFHYISSPAMSMDACLKMTAVEIDLIQDINIYLFFENAIRGGISMASRHFASANNKYLDNYDPNDVSSWIYYIDASKSVCVCVCVRGVCVCVCVWRGTRGLLHFPPPS